jgi:hypothetical protein
MSFSFLGCNRSKASLCNSSFDFDSKKLQVNLIDLIILYHSIGWFKQWNVLDFEMADGSSLVA